MKLSDKIALITGSGRNIGRATALKLASEGATLAINARQNMKEAKSVCDEILSLGGDALPFIADVGIESEVAEMVSRIEASLGAISILVNNAGLRESAVFANMSTEEWRRVISVNLDGPFFCARAVIPGMLDKKWGRIINISGLNAFKGRSGWAHVSASKMGAIGLTRSLSEELAGSGILVNHIVPGAFNTQQDLSTSPHDPSIVKGIPVGRLGRPEEIAETAAFLVSEGANYITGQTIHVNGGALNN